jgi:flavin-binding protein dodecin
VDGSGNAYLCGSSQDGIGVAGLPQADRLDAFLVRHNANGTLAWARQMGNTGNDQCLDVAVDGSGRVYVIGTSQNGLDGAAAGAFLRRYSASGTLEWTRVFGAAATSAAGYGIEVDSAGNSYITGQTMSGLGGTHAGGWDAFLLRYNADGTQAWVRQLGTSGHDQAYGVALDGSGAVYIAGTTNGSLALPNAGSSDAFLARYDTAGTQLWTRQFGTEFSDGCRGIATDGAGNIFLAGETGGQLGESVSGFGTAYLARYDATGTLHGIHQFGTSEGEIGVAVAVDGQGNVHLCGSTNGSLGGSNVGFKDLYLAKFTQPFPTLSFMLALKIAPHGTNYDFNWASRPGKLYDLVSSTTLDTSPATWPVWQGHGNLTSNPARSNTLTAIPGGGDPRRFFCVIEKDAP